MKPKNIIILSLACAVVAGAGYAVAQQASIFSYGKPIGSGPDYTQIMTDNVTGCQYIHETNGTGISTDTPRLNSRGVPWCRDTQDGPLPGAG